MKKEIGRFEELIGIIKEKIKKMEITETKEISNNLLEGSIFNKDDFGIFIASYLYSLLKYFDNIIDSYSYRRLMRIYPPGRARQKATEGVFNAIKIEKIDELFESMIEYSSEKDDMTANKLLKNMMCIQSQLAYYTKYYKSE